MRIMIIMSAPRQHGVALLYTLFVLIVVLLLGASGAQLALQGEKAARGERDRHIAFHAAEEALLDAENDIEAEPGATGRGARFAPDNALGFADGCGGAGAGDQAGLCLRAADAVAPVWQSVDLGAAGAQSVAYGQFTGAVMPTGQGFLPARAPRYIIEVLPYHLAGEEAGLAPALAYRVTALGFGAREADQVVLQTIYRKQLSHAEVK